MDHETRMELEKARAALASTQEILQQTAGRALALDAALSATLRSWGAPADVVATEVKRVLELGAVEAARRGAQRPMLEQYGLTGETFIAAILAAAEHDPDH